MGHRLELFLNPDEIDPEFICSICHYVMKSPTMTNSCEHIFCYQCITQWQSTSSTCPIDRRPITSLRDPIRAYMNLYNGIKLKCTIPTCDHVTNLGGISAHYNSCLHNLDAVVQCPTCDGQTKRKDMPSHVCLEYLKAQVKDLKEKEQKSNQQITSLQKVLKEKNRQIGRLHGELRRIRRTT